MKRIFQSIVAAVGLTIVAATPALAQGLSVNLTGTNNYVWRGHSQTLNDPAVQGGVDYDFGNGLAVGTWASSIDFGDDSPMEVDVYGSYTGSISDMFGYTIGGIGYLYPDAPSGFKYDFFEIYGGPNITLGTATVTGRVYYSPEFLGSTGPATYITGGIAVPFGFVTATGNIGYSDFDVVSGYLDWNVGLAASYEFLTLTGMIIGTDLPGAKERGVVLLTAKFAL